VSAAAASRPLGELLDARQRWLLMASLMVSMFMGALDQTIMATAAPRIVADLGGFHLLSWVFTTYMLSSTVVVPLVGKLSDIYGRKIFLMSGMIVFLAASAGCGAAPNMAALIGFRALQGAGGGTVFSSVFATIGDIFPPAERGKYMGLFTGTFTLASVLGPTVGGLLTDHAGWRWVFYINIPVGAIALPAIWYNLPLARSNRRTRIDYLGALLLSMATVSALLALAWSGEERGWTSPPTLLLFATSLIAILAFVLQERSHPEPIVPFHLFRIREFLLGNLIVLSIGLAMMGMVPYLPTFLQTALDASATASGLVTTPQSLGLLVTSILGGQLLSRTGHYKLQTVIGAFLILCAVTLMLTLGPNSPAWHLSAFVVVLGLGGGLAMPTMSVVIQNAVPHEFLGVATSSRQFFMQIGGVVGTAIFGVLLTTAFQSDFRNEVSPDTRSQVDAAVLQKFEDPTLALDERTFTQVSTQILSQPDGQVLLADTQQAQREAITVAIHRVFLCSICIVIATVLLSLLLKEVPLRRTFGPQEAGEEADESQPSEPALAMH
jgi:EmrB/QacA subfamily drug resistance transporter